jgi:hypothetical protein
MLLFKCIVKPVYRKIPKEIEHRFYSGMHPLKADIYLEHCDSLGTPVTILMTLVRTTVHAPCITTRHSYYVTHNLSFRVSCFEVSFLSFLILFVFPFVSAYQIILHVLLTQSNSNLSKFLRNPPSKTNLTCTVRRKILRTNTRKYFRIIFQTKSLFFFHFLPQMFSLLDVILHHVSHFIQETRDFSREKGFRLLGVPV